MSPVINLNFDGVETFDSLPLGKYAGQIDKIELRPAQEEGKFDQIMATYLVTDGDLLGRKQSEFLSMSPKAAFRLKKWFDHFGLGDEVSLDFDDESNLLIEPDLTAIDVSFEVYLDPKLYQGEKQIRTRLVEVFEDEPEPAPAPTKKAKAAPAPVVEEEEEEEEEDEPAPPPKRAKAKPAPVVVEEEEDDEEEEEAPAPAPVRRARAAAPVAAGPARRSLR